MEEERERKRIRLDEPAEKYQETKMVYSQPVDLDDWEEKSRRHEEETDDERAGSSGEDTESSSSASSDTDSGEFSYGGSSEEERRVPSTMTPSEESDDDGITGQIIQSRESWNHRGARRTCQTCRMPYNKQQHQRHFHWRIERKTESTTCYHCFEFGAYRCVFCQNDFCRICMAMHLTEIVESRKTCAGDSWSHMIAVRNLALQDRGNS